jgi:hypothetical protein
VFSSRYQEEIFTGRDVRHQCIRIASPAKNGSNMPWVVSVFIVVGILLALICGAGVYRFACQRFWKKGNVNFVFVFLSHN